jgi:hypothetical protein
VGFLYVLSVCCGALFFDKHCVYSYLFICEGSPFEKLGEGAKYEELFVTAMKNHGILCIGLYRLNIIVYCLMSLF